MKLPLRLVLFSIMQCHIIVWSSFTCFQLFHVSSKNSSSFNNNVWIRINILLVSHNVTLCCLLKFSALPLHVKLLYFL